MNKRKCITPRCRNKTSRGFCCSTCRARKTREADPIRYAYTTSKNNAKRRGKIFELTFEQFKAFFYKYDYIKGKGRTKESFTIDCIINDLGYVEGNIRILPLVDNARKGVKMLSYDWQTNYATVLRIARDNADNWDELD
jgi:hypothetical protein